LSTFEVKVRRVVVSEHPDPEVHSLELGQVDDYHVVVGKGQFHTNDLAVYIPEQAVVPDAIIEEMGLTGRLAGSKKNRVKAIRLRGELSQGLLYVPQGRELREGEELGEEFGIYKHEPPIPQSMAGKVQRLGPGPGQESFAEGFFRTYTDIENIKKYPDAFEDGEDVVITEKLHGSCCIVGIVSGQRIVSSKGIAKRDLILQEEEGNVYWRIVKQMGLHEKLEGFLEEFQHIGITDVLLFGEVLGVQDLMYGCKPGELDFRAFDVYVNYEKAGPQFLDHPIMVSVLIGSGIPMVPVLYKGPFSKEKLTELTSGESTLAGHIREGVVVKSYWEKEDRKVGRKILKSISPEYLLRKGGTELE